MKKNLLRITLLMVAALLFCSSFACAEEKADAVAMVKAAVAYYHANGLEKTLDAINDPKGQFVKGELYIFSFDSNGVMMANALKQNLVGQSVIDVPDPKGKMFRREIVERANKGESGWVDYSMQNPKTKELQEKTSYFEKVGELILSCGVYKK